ncbi:lanC-like protein 3 homolog [Nylanderia fulva]|uniref:lanC-like protein 3 homolog n=1 Tax=Nylanderia fulva TaxID=613905 RepID=UPI0010FAF16A|nr:lanC-like protein 3 homolog [Nylanderia fulva]XP_029167223.1 lanC-like protein 3 homolog [Nylanderia fulva]
MLNAVRCVYQYLLRWKVNIRNFSDTMSQRSRYFVNEYCAQEEKIAGSATSLQRDIHDSQSAAKTNLRKILQRIVDKEPPERAETDGGLYVGASGISYTFLRLAEHPLLKDDADKHLSLAERYLRSSLTTVQRHEGRSGTGFLLGDWGILAVGAVLATVQGDEKTASELVKRYVTTGARCKEVNFLKCGSDEFFVGRAGFLYGALWLNRMMKNTVVPLDMMHEIARTIVASGQMYARVHNSPCPLMYAYYGTEYLGAAHGLCAILQILIQVPSFLDDNEDINNTTRTCVDYFLSLQMTSGNFPCATDEIDYSGRSVRDSNSELVHWCHGAPGAIYLMAAAYLRWKDQRYLNSCVLAGDLVWRKGLLKKGPGICHGVAGNGYVFLLLYRLTGNELHLYRAAKFADFMNSPQFQSDARTPDSPYSLYEGIAGTACFLSDLIEPDKAHFPFQDVF